MLLHEDNTCNMSVECGSVLVGLRGLPANGHSSGRGMVALYYLHVQRAVLLTSSAPFNLLRI